MKITVQEPTDWKTYRLLDSGDGQKLEQVGEYRFVRPEPQAIWHRSWQETEWEAASAVFKPTAEESGGHWAFKKKVESKWSMSYNGIKFWAMTTSGRHLGFFPESANHWDWFRPLIRNKIQSRTKAPIDTSSPSNVEVLNLFGYTGLATLASSLEGAKVTHVDASKKSVNWARDNQELSGLGNKPIRWIVDDALKFVQREARRGVRYDGLIVEPPKFGRGPKGEVWEVFKSLPTLLKACRDCLSEEPLFVVLTLYAIRTSALHLEQVLQELMSGFQGVFECGELALREQSAGRLISQAVFARWQHGNSQ